MCLLLRFFAISTSAIAGFYCNSKWNEKGTPDIIHIILGFMVVRRRFTYAASVKPPYSNYDNLSLTQSLEESFSIDLEFGSASTSRAR